ncbi:hypothetical protein [Leifsonia sp. Leaf264]|uniref:hypothetical protein n=1 Tax=Leifsonia sp. Leaf264 TaxID=1736314 RepID=UPI0006F55F60|nr:hypothetical protein [Leifsonia sp. Leaf264]KQP01400.1 hypothetical protein ASF30_01935 [Leifsonia sp. Leaf264]
MKTMKLALIGAITALLVLAPLTTSPSLAAGNRVQEATNLNVRTVSIPEWYQFCANTRPVGITSAKAGYMNAYKEASGVTCKWWVIPWGAGFPHTVKKYYSWDSVCRYYGSRFAYVKNGYPWCW